MRESACAARPPACVYFTGGATPVLEGWRTSTSAVNVRLVPRRDLLRAIPKLKGRRELNVELAAPLDFIPTDGKIAARSFVRKDASRFTTASSARRALAALNHPHIAQIFGFEQADGAGTYSTDTDCGVSR